MSHCEMLPGIVVRIGRRFGLLGLASMAAPFLVVFWAGWYVDFSVGGATRPFGLFVGCAIVCVIAFAAMVSVWQMRVETRLHCDVASKGFAVCFECGHRLAGSGGHCPKCDWEYDDIEQVVSCWANWKPSEYLFRRTSVEGTDAPVAVAGARSADGSIIDCNGPGVVTSGRVLQKLGSPLILNRILNRHDALGLIAFLSVVGVYMVHVWNVPGSGTPSLSRMFGYIAAGLGTTVLCKVFRLFAEQRLKRDVAGKNNAACFGCGYWLTEPSGRCPECGWAYESLEEVRGSWTEWQPCWYFLSRRNRRRQGAGDTLDQDGADSAATADQR